MSATLSMLELPMPEDDMSMSEDEFEGYLDDNDLTGGSDNSHEPSDGVQDSSINSPQPDDVGYTPIPEFDQPVGCAEDMTGASPLQFFQQMVTEEMLEKIVEQTNLYAQQYMQSTNLPPHSRAHGWSRATFDTAELKKFLAMTITMGLVSYPELEDYWSTSWPYATSAFSKVCVCVCVCARVQLSSLFFIRYHNKNL